MVTVALGRRAGRLLLHGGENASLLMLEHNTRTSAASLGYGSGSRVSGGSATAAGETLMRYTTGEHSGRSGSIVGQACSNTNTRLSSICDTQSPSNTFTGQEPCATAGSPCRHKRSPCVQSSPKNPNLAVHALWKSGSTSSSVGGGGRRARSTSASPPQNGEKGFSTTTIALMLSQPLPHPCKCVWTQPGFKGQLKGKSMCRGHHQALHQAGRMLFLCMR